MSALRLLAVVAVVGLAGGAARAADNAKMLVGKWEVTKADEGTVPAGTMIEFTKDGKIKLTGKKEGEDVSHEGTYKVDGDTFTITMKAKDKEVTHKITIVKISEKELSTKNEEGKMVELKKKKS